MKIAIVGAGPAGCTLARLLLCSPAAPNLSITIFEGDQSPDFRSQGGTLDLHERTGLAALKQCGLFDQFTKLARYDGEAITICDKNLLRYVHMPGTKDSKSSRGRPEIDRVQLRKLLLQSLPDGMVRWGWKVQSVNADTHSVLFKDGRVESGWDLIVGADGAWSKVRQVLTDVAPHYSGIGGVQMNITEPEHSAPDLLKLVERGSLFAFSDRKTLIVQQIGDGSLGVSTWSVRPESWTDQAGYDVQNLDETKQATLKEYHDWSDELVVAIRAADELLAPRNLHMLPIGQRWAHRPGFTLVGDAAHLMTPFAGEGVNLAMQDAMCLAEHIVRSNTDGKGEDALEDALRSYEEDMYVRAAKVQQLTFDMMNLMFFENGAPRSSIERYVLRAMSDEVPSLLWWPLTACVYAYFFVFKLIW